LEWGLARSLFWVSLGFGLQRLLLNRITSSDALLSLSVTSSDPEAIPLGGAFLNKMEAIEGVEEVSPLISFSSQIVFNHLGTNVAARAIEPSYFRLAATQAKAGRLFKEGEEDRVVLSTAALQALEITDPNSIINQKITLEIFLEGEATVSAEMAEVPVTKSKAEHFLVSGVIEDEIISFAYISASQVSDLEIENYEEVKIKVADSELLDQARDKIIYSGLMVSSLSDTIEETNQVFRIIQVVLALFGAIALFVAAIGMFNTMTIALLERTREIGIMKALGATNRDVMKIFLAESMIIGFLGGASGVLIGQGGGLIVNLAINFLASRLGGQSLSIFYFPPIFIFIVIGFSTIIGFLTGLYPARHASKLSPLDALRYK